MLPFKIDEVVCLFANTLTCEERYYEEIMFLLNVIVIISNFQILSHLNG